RKYGRIHHIQVQGKVNGNLLQLFQGFLKALKIKFSGFYMVFSPVKFFPVSGADTKLIDTSVSCQLPASSQHTGVGKFCSQIFMAQICMGVKMNHMDVRKFFNRCPESTQGHQMFSSQHKRYLPVIQYGLCPFFNICQGQLGISKTQLQISRIHDPVISQIPVLIRTVAFQPKGLMADSAAAESGSRAKRSAGIKRRSEKHDIRFLIISVTFQISLNVCSQHLSKAPLHMPGDKKLPCAVWWYNTW